MSGKCDMTMYTPWVIGIYSCCDRPTKWLSPEPILGKIYELCGIHRNSVDIGYKNRKSKLRCIPI